MVIIRPGISRVKGTVVNLGMERCYARLLSGYTNVNHVTRPDAFDRFHQQWEQRSKVVDPILANTDNHNPKGEFLKIVLEAKSLVDCNEHIKVSLRQRHQLFVGQAPPSRLGDRNYFMIGEGLTNSRVNALVYEDAHSISCCLANSRNKTACSRLTVTKSRRKLSRVSSSSM